MFILNAFSANEFVLRLFYLIFYKSANILYKNFIAMEIYDDKKTVLLTSLISPLIVTNKQPKQFVILASYTERVQ